MDGIWMLLRTLFALAVVLGTAVAGARAFARLQRPRGPGRLDVLGVVPLGGRRSMAVVRLGQRAIVVGVGDHEVSCLHVIEDPLEVAALAGEPWMTLDEAAARAERPAPALGRLTVEAARALWAQPLSGTASGRPAPGSARPGLRAPAGTGRWRLP